MLFNTSTSISLLWRSRRRSSYVLDPSHLLEHKPEPTVLNAWTAKSAMRFGIKSPRSLPLSSSLKSVTERMMQKSSSCASLGPLIPAATDV